MRADRGLVFAEDFVRAAHREHEANVKVDGLFRLIADVCGAVAEGYWR
jgi:hypothetical protein